MKRNATSPPGMFSGNLNFGAITDDAPDDSGADGHLGHVTNSIRNLRGVALA